MFPNGRLGDELPLGIQSDIFGRFLEKNYSGLGGLSLGNFF